MASGSRFLNFFRYFVIVEVFIHYFLFLLVGTIRLVGRTGILFSDSFGYWIFSAHDLMVVETFFWPFSFAVLAGLLKFANIFMILFLFFRHFFPTISTKINLLILLRMISWAIVGGSELALNQMNAESFDREEFFAFPATFGLSFWFLIRVFHWYLFQSIL